jgi:hypothetical protein
VLCTDSVAFNTTTIPQLGRGVATVLTLPIETIDRDYANGHVYLSSFQLTQPQLFKELLEASGTVEDDWKITHQVADDVLRAGQEQLAKGEMAGISKLLAAAHFKEGDNSAKLQNEKLGLPKEDLQVVLRDALAQYPVDSAY